MAQIDELLLEEWMRTLAMKASINEKDQRQEAIQAVSQLLQSPKISGSIDMIYRVIMTLYRYNAQKDVINLAVDAYIASWPTMTAPRDRLSDFLVLCKYEIICNWVCRDFPIDAPLIAKEIFDCEGVKGNAGYYILKKWRHLIPSKMMMTYLNPAKCDFLSINSLLKAISVSEKDFDLIANVAASSVANNLSNPEWMSRFIYEAINIFGEKVVRPWSRLNVQRYSENEDIWKPILDKALKHGWTMFFDIEEWSLTEVQHAWLLWRQSSVCK